MPFGSLHWRGYGAAHSTRFPSLEASLRGVERESMFRGVEKEGDGYAHHDHETARAVRNRFALDLPSHQAAERSAFWGECACDARRVLMVRDRRKPRAPKRVGHSPQPFDLPSQVTAEIERSEAYRAALAKLITLSGDFEAALSAPQRARWLALEDAMFEYAQMFGVACYRAGRRASQRKR